MESCCRIAQSFTAIRQWKIFFFPDGLNSDSPQHSPVCPSTSLFSSANHIRPRWRPSPRMEGKYKNLDAVRVGNGLRPNTQTGKLQKLCVPCSSQPGFHKYPSSHFSKLLSLDKVLKSHSKDICFGGIHICQTTEYLII